MNSEPAHIWITADDAGASDVIDAAVLRLTELGILTGAAVLTNYRRSLESLRSVLGMDASVGIHFNLSSGTPLSHRSAVASLVDEHGCFQNPRIYYKRSIASALEAFVNQNVGHFKYSEVVHELRAQLAAFVDHFGAAPCFATVHHDLDVVPLVRRACEEAFPSCIPRQSRLRAGIQADILSDFLKPHDCINDAVDKIRCLIDRAIMISRATRLPCEIVCHPASGEHSLEDFTVYVSQRLVEFHGWSSSSVRLPLLSAGRRTNGQWRFDSDLAWSDVRE